MSTMTVSNQYLAWLASEVWALDPNEFQRYYAMFSSLQDVDEKTFDAAATRQPQAATFTKQGATAVISIRGMLLESIPSFFAWMGIAATAYADIIGQARAAAADPDVKEIILDVNSPGGSVSGMTDAADAIKLAAAQKPVHARGENMIGSAAFWLSSQATTISLNKTGEAGSIGVLKTLVDSSKRAEQMGFEIHVIKSGPHKGTGAPGAPITEAQLIPIQEAVDALAIQFQDAVKAGRGARLTAEPGIFASGRTWIAEGAMALGLIDTIHDDKTKAGGQQITAAKAEQTKENETMSEETDIKKVQEDAGKAALAADQTRREEITTAFPDDPAFALTQCNAGASVIEAKAAYSDVLKSRLDESKKNEADALAKAEAKAKAEAAQNSGEAEGGEFVPQNAGANSDGKGTGAFMALVNEQVASGKSRNKAFKDVASKNPELREAFVKEHNAAHGR